MVVEIFTAASNTASSKNQLTGPLNYNRSPQSPGRS
jgi:hypothetical protein